ncbi:glycerophosphodiester phosphodiesterase [Steroidobacter sp.]|uniref:glycerophosphodiester phosphodiesterase n=1 Tax=Steroidobacter sp. TaxID=1978227 RepID=UPI001A3A5563|nr:glycerophosphodiester phosphodiesterase [Steroidobacter sp.]MBL8271195.1 glycerophosphodiester phosphodiesterase [Steroidobacter sp.]
MAGVRSLGFLWVLVLTMSGTVSAQSANKKWATLDGAPPLVIAHRGASGYRPEHTLASYQLAIEFGADYVEPDLVATRDGHLVARHEPLLDDTTDVKSRPEFASRLSTKNLDGKQVTGFFASDFTLAEIRQLRAVQPNPARSKEYDGKFTVPTFEEILDLVAQESAKRGRSIGIYPETKHPAFHLGLQLPLEDRLLEVLNRRGLNKVGTPIFIQSFESANLQYLRPKTELPMVQLMEEGSLIYDESGKRVVSVSIPNHGDARGGKRPSSLADVAKYANAIGPWKRQILRDVGQPTLLTTTVIEQAHAAGLRVHTYTFRNEPATLAPEYHNDPLQEYRRFFELGIDGVFSDFADTALKARAAWASR